MTATERTALIEDHLHLVRIIAIQLRRHLRNRVPLDELVSSGFVGLIQAADRFDPEAGTKFASYSGYRIRWAMIDALRSQHLVVDCERIRRIEKGDRKPLPKFCQLPEFADNREVCPIEDRKAAPPDRQAEDEEFRELVTKDLSPGQKGVIIGRYFDGLKFREIAQRLGVSMQRAHWLHRSALEELRARLWERRPCRSSERSACSTETRSS